MDLQPFLENFPAGLNIALKSGKSEFSFTTSDQILAFRRDQDGSSIAIFHNREVPAVPLFDELRTTLRKIGHWVHCRRELFVNLSRVRSVRRITKEEYLLITDTGFEFPLNSAYQAGVQNYFEIPTLAHVTPFSLPSYWKLRLSIKDIPIKSNILFMPEEKILANFGTSTGKVIVSTLIVNFLWQQALRIRAGMGNPVEGGNVRSLWYLIKPLLSRLGLLDGTNHYKTLSQKLAELVAHKIVSYRDFDLYEDGRWEIGQKNPHIILMAEKSAHFRFLQQMKEALSCSIISTSGMPKTITSEYFTTDLKTAVDGHHLKDRVVIISLVDYDPAGHLILDTFRNDLKVFGVKHPTPINLSNLKNYTAEEIKFMHFNLLEEDEIPGKILKDWMKKTGGINGKPLGMEVDVLMMDRPRVKKLVQKEARPWLKPISRLAQKRIEVFSYEDELHGLEPGFDLDFAWRRFE